MSQWYNVSTRTQLILAYFCEINCVSLPQNLYITHKEMVFGDWAFEKLGLDQYMKVELS